MNLTTFKTLVMREYWENKSFVRAPLIIAGVILFSVIVGMFSAQNMIFSMGDQAHIEIGAGFEELDNATSDELTMAMKGIQYGLFLSPLSVGFVFVIFFYALGSLYNERRDRSILFWKSMPISDTETVLSKVFSVFVTAPVITAVVAMASQLFGLIILTLMVWINGGSAWNLIWAHSSILTVFFNDFALLLIIALWMAPILGWLWLVSSYANKAAFLIAVFVPLGLIFVEGMIFRTSNFVQLIGDHLSQIELIVEGTVENNHPFEIVATSGFWIGIVICAAMIAGATYIRRFRDDSY
ncbi:MAG: hypothetical protein V2I33_11505 [Kangiellaceae bacterium]|jgi:ABC-2 type transport system permease protein|nr:hypothetical protein [Kangiellaceae bacterium]